MNLKDFVRGYLKTIQARLRSRLKRVKSSVVVWLNTRAPWN